MAVSLNVAIIWKPAWKLNETKFKIYMELYPNMLLAHLRDMLSPEMIPTIWHFAKPNFKNEILYSEFTKDELKEALGAVKYGKAVAVNAISVDKLMK